MKLKPVTDKVACDAYDATKLMVEQGWPQGQAMRMVAKRFAGHGHCEMILMQELIVMVGMVQVCGVAA